VGCWRLWLPLELVEDDAADVLVVLCVVVFVVVAFVVVVCAWEARATTSEMAAAAVTAPAAIQRLIRLVRVNPASRVLIALLLMPAMLAAGSKKTLSRL
jgi:hypothetical protein